MKKAAVSVTPAGIVSAERIIMDITSKLIEFVKNVFKTDLEIFLKALKLSPNAQGYVHGSISELLLKQELEVHYDCEIKRIREKWEGKKLLTHHGDFYFKKRNEPFWYVIESKGIKSNSEKWHTLYNLDKLIKFLITNSDKIQWIDTSLPIEKQINDWIKQHLPRYLTDFADPIYDYDHIQQYATARKTSKSEIIEKLRQYSRDEIDKQISERILYLNTKLRVIETHFVSGKSDSSERTQATPKISEFNIMAIDIALKHCEHKFFYANPKSLEPSSADASHLQQNYIMGFIFIGEDGTKVISLTEDWYEDFNEVYSSLQPTDAVDEKDMQVDMRFIEEIGEDFIEEQDPEEHDRN